jgi:hypothetical protein
MDIMRLFFCRAPTRQTQDVEPAERLSFVFEPVARKARPRPISFEFARCRMVDNLRAELARFVQGHRDTRHIKRIAPTFAVFRLGYGVTEAFQAKLTFNPRQSPERAARPMFAAILNGAVDEPLRHAYDTGMARLAAARTCRAAKRASVQR